MTESRPDNEAIFHAARDIPDPDRRREYVREACGGDEARIAHIAALLAAADRTDSLLDRMAADVSVATIDQPTTESPRTVIGPYKLIEQIGEGGMGGVWMAQQTAPVKRFVAVKLIKAGMDSRQVIARFEAERQALALMDHPNIARVLDGGTTSGGRPYFVMDLVKGVPITRYCDEHHLTPRQRLELFIPVCQAVQHAHQKGIIHRDLKPSNVLVALYDGKPVPKIIDVGVAKAAGQQLTDKTLVTGFGAIVGTLEYMSPEQAEVNQLDIDTRSDIYSLGVLLYELLTGSPPFTQKALTQAGLLEMLRVIREQEPTKPSTKLSTAEGLPTLAANRGTEPAKLKRLVRGDLDWIVMKALEKDRDRRYESANGFAIDVQRYLANEPVQACPPSAVYRFRKFARRNRVALAATVAVGFAVVLGTGVALWQANRAFRAEEQAKYHRNLVEQQESAVQRSQYVAHMTLAVQAWARGDIPHVLERLDAGRPESGQRDLRSVGWYHLWQQCHRDRLTFRGHAAAVYRLAFSPDGKSLATASKDRTIKLWDVATGREQATLTGHTNEVNCVAFSPDGTILASASDDRTVRLWDRATGALQRLLIGHTGNVLWVAFSPSGTMLATSSGDKTIKLWDLPAGQERATLGEHTAEIDEVRFSPDGRLLASCADDATVRLWDPGERKERAVLKGHTGSANSIAFAPQGRLLASAGSDGAVRLWEVANGREQAVLRGHTSNVRSLAISPDGAMLASGSKDGTAKLWDLARREPRRTLVGHGGEVLGAVFSPDGRLLATASADGTAKLWDALARPNPLILRGHTGDAYAVAFSPDGKMLASGSSEVKLWNTATGREEAILRTRNGVLAVAFSPDGKTLATAPVNTVIELWDLETRSVRRTLPGHENLAVQRLAFSPDGSMLASCGDDHAVRLWDPAAGNELATLRGHTAPIDCVAFSPDGKTLASGCRDATVRLWDLASRREVAVLEPHAGHIRTVEFSPDGKTLAHGTEESTILLWDVASRQLRATLRGHSVYVHGLAFSGDGAMLASGSLDGTAKLWDLATGVEYATLADHTAGIDGIALSPDGKTLATGSRDRTVRLWDLTTLTDEAYRTSGSDAAHFRLASALAEATAAAGDAADVLKADFGLASALAQAKQWDRSASVYAAALKRFGAEHWPGPWYEAIRSDEVFTRLTAQQPGDRLPRIMRARLHVFERDWKRAAAEYARAYESLGSIDPAKLLPEGGDDMFCYGCLLLLLGDRHGYERFCKTWADRVGDAPAWGYDLARAWGVSPRPVVPSRQIVERAGKTVQANRTPWDLHVLSLADYRNGEFKLAIERARESNGGTWVGSAKALNWLVLAMSHSRLGQAADARHSLRQALELAGRASPEKLPGVAWPDMGPQDLVECELLRREAEELIDPKSKEKPDKKSG